MCVHYQEVEWVVEQEPGLDSKHTKGFGYCMLSPDSVLGTGNRQTCRSRQWDSGCQGLGEGMNNGKLVFKG